MSWFRRKMRTESDTGDRANADRVSRLSGKPESGLPDERRAASAPELPRGIDAGFCWGDEQARS
jgi:hypothetical protein